MKLAPLAALSLVLCAPTLAQDATGVPLLRVYIDAPYFYEILASVTDASDQQAHRLTLAVEGKEVGESAVIYNCGTGEYSEKVISDWTGNAAAFIGPALLAYGNLYC